MSRDSLQILITLELAKELVEISIVRDVKTGIGISPKVLQEWIAIKRRLRREIVFAGETVISGAPHPGTPLQVLFSAAGYYLGYLTQEGEPYSRETAYMSMAAAESLLGAFRK